jgi:hypothetical protein
MKRRELFQHMIFGIEESTSVLQKQFDEKANEGGLDNQDSEKSGGGGTNGFKT